MKCQCCNGSTTDAGDIDLDILPGRSSTGNRIISGLERYLLQYNKPQRRRHTKTEERIVSIYGVLLPFLPSCAASRGQRRQAKRPSSQNVASERHRSGGGGIGCRCAVVPASDVQVWKGGLHPAIYTHSWTLFNNDGPAAFSKNEKPISIGSSLVV
jgi:hypothetical protein